MRPVLATLVAATVTLCTLTFPVVTLAEQAGPAAPLYIGPRLGPSMVTGYLGIEAQYGDHLAVGGGLLFDDGYAFGVKYLLSPYPNSIYLFGSHLRVRANEGGPEEEPRDRIITNTGVGFGWQNRWKNGFIACAGVGPSYYDDPDSSPRVMVVVDFSIGYAFRLH